MKIINDVVVIVLIKNQPFSQKSLKLTDKISFVKKGRPKPVMPNTSMT